jgi:hypothetical protein
MARLVVISWRDIPSQVNAQAGRRRHQVQLSERFQLAIDRAAMVAGLHGSDDYLAQWTRSSSDCGDDLEAAASAAAVAIEAQYPPDRLAALVAAGGLAG